MILEDISKFMVALVLTAIIILAVLDVVNRHTKVFSNIRRTLIEKGKINFFRISTKIIYFFITFAFIQLSSKVTFINIGILMGIFVGIDMIVSREDKTR